MSDELAQLIFNPTKAILDAGGVSQMMSLRHIRSVDAILAMQAAGYDSFFVDLEHGNMTLSDTGQLCVAGMLAGMGAFVRVPTLEPCRARPGFRRHGPRASSPRDC